MRQSFGSAVGFVRIGEGASGKAKVRVLRDELSGRRWSVRDIQFVLRDNFAESIARVGFSIL